jgi:hypothetical protein
MEASFRFTVWSAPALDDPLQECMFEEEVGEQQKGRGNMLGGRGGNRSEVDNRLGG